MVKDLPEAKRAKTKVVFISVDPERDTMEVLREKVKNYGPHFVGATDTPENLEKVLKLFGARYAKLQNVDGETLIDHTSQVFIINRDGKWVDSIEFDSTVQQFRTAYDQSFHKPAISQSTMENKPIPVWGSVENCDVAKTKCKLKSFDGEEFEMQLGPQPVESEKQLQVQVTTRSQRYFPIAVDFQGVESFMGYIRPALASTQAYDFQGAFTLPICELPSMNWKARLMVKDMQDRTGVLSLTSQQLETSPVISRPPGASQFVLLL